MYGVHRDVLRERQRRQPHLTLEELKTPDEKKTRCNFLAFSIGFAVFLLLVDDRGDNKLVVLVSFGLSMLAIALVYAVFFIWNNRKRIFSKVFNHLDIRLWVALSSIWSFAFIGWYIVDDPYRFNTPLLLLPPAVGLFGVFAVRWARKL